MKHWLELLRERADAVGQEKAGEEIGVARATVSLCLSGKYPASTRRIELRVMTAYGHVECPFLAKRITFSECREHHTKEAPTSSPFAMRHWKACRTCPNNKARGND